MTLINQSILFGLLVVAIPIALHLMLRAKPKKLVFPALRLIQDRRRQSVQRLRLRHLLLLLLRMGILALLVFALTRPSLPAADYSLNSGDWIKLVTLVALCVATYFGALRLWNRSRPSPHVLMHRRSLLRGGLTLVGIVLLLLLVAWPYQRRISASITQPNTSIGEHVPVAAVLLFDTSLSMEYRFESKTRLELAREIATQHLSRLPALSRIAICDSTGDDPVRFQADIRGAEARIGALVVSPSSRMLNDRLEAAIQFQIEEDERLRGGVPAGASPPRESFVREIYVFTDLAASAWRRDDTPRLKQLLERVPGLSVYLIDVGVAQPTNTALTALTLSRETIALGNELTIRATLESVGDGPPDRTVELYLQNDAGKLVKLEQTIVKAVPNAPAQLQFSRRDVTGPVRQGEIRIVASDPLAFDDVRYFTVEVQPPQEILVVAESRAEARYVMEALAPAELSRLGKARYRCQFATPGQMLQENLKRFAAVCLLDVADPGTAGWDALADYLSKGGGVGVVLGGRVDQKAYLTPAAQSILPAELLAPIKFAEPEFMDLHDLTHPLLKRFEDWGVGELTSQEIHRCWRVNPVKEARVIARYTDRRGAPALLERTHGKGRLVMLTTPLDRTGWNEMPASGWSFLAFLDQMAHYLASSTGNVLNYVAGAPVVINLDPTQSLKQYLLRKPGLQQLRGEVAGGTSTLQLREIDQLGNYRLFDADADSKLERGFSVNPAAGESDLSRVPATQFDRMLGKDHYSISRNIEGLRRSVHDVRVGREIFPLLVALLLIVFVGEQWVANRFYEGPQAPAEPAPA